MTFSTFKWIILMVAILVRHQRSGRTGVLDDTRNREYIQVFRVLVTSSLDGPEIAGSAIGIPRIWTPYLPPSGKMDLGSWCRRVEATPTESDYVWEVKCNYSSRLEKGDKRPDQQNENPMLRPIEIEFGTNRVSRPFEYDRLGYPVTNSAGEPFDPPVMMDEKILTIRISKNKATYDQGYHSNFIDSLNSDRWMGFLRGQVKCVDIRASLQWEGSFAFFRVTYMFEAKQARIPKNCRWGNKKDKIGKRVELSWCEFILDRGYRELYFDEDTEEYKLRPIINPDGIGTVSTPALLNGEGEAILQPMARRTEIGDHSDEEEDAETAWPGGSLPPESGNAAKPADDDGTLGTTRKDPVFLVYNRFPLRKFAALGLF